MPKVISAVDPYVISGVYSDTKLRQVQDAGGDVGLVLIMLRALGVTEKVKLYSDLFGGANNSDDEESGFARMGTVVAGTSSAITNAAAEALHGEQKQDNAYKEALDTMEKLDAVQMVGQGFLDEATFCVVNVTDSGSLHELGFGPETTAYHYAWKAVRNLSLSGADEQDQRTVDAELLQLLNEGLQQPPEAQDVEQRRPLDCSSQLDQLRACVKQMQSDGYHGVQTPAALLEAARDRLQWKNIDKIGKKTLLWMRQDSDAAREQDPLLSRSVSKKLKFDGKFGDVLAAHPELSDVLVLTEGEPDLEQIFCKMLAAATECPMDKLTRGSGTFKNERETHVVTQ